MDTSLEGRSRRNGQKGGMIPQKVIEELVQEGRPIIKKLAKGGARIIQKGNTEVGKGRARQKGRILE